MSIRSDLGPIKGISTTTAVSGMVRQMISANTTAADNTTATFNWTDTIPQASQGKIFLSATITPNSTGNQLFIDFSGVFAMATVGNMVVGLFAGPTGGASGDAVAAVASHGTGNDPLVLAFCYAGFPTAATTHVYSVRYGPATGQILTLNGASTNRYLGGVSNTRMIIQEVVG